MKFKCSGKVHWIGGCKNRVKMSDMSWRSVKKGKERM